MTGPWLGPLAEAAVQPADGQGWHYAMWVALDVRLLLFVSFVSLLTSVALTAFLGRGRSRLEQAALLLLCFVVVEGLTIWAFNALAQYPVFRVESFFPFP